MIQHDTNVFYFKLSKGRERKRLTAFRGHVTVQFAGAGESKISRKRRMSRKPKTFS